MDEFVSTKEKKEKKNKEDVHHYHIAIPDALISKIERVVALKRALGSAKTSRSEFIREAISAKLERDAEDPAKYIEPEKRVYLKYDAAIEKEIQKHINWIRQYRAKYTKKRWIEDAIFEKLENEEPELQEKFAESKNILLKQRDLHSKVDSTKRES